MTIEYLHASKFGDAAKVAAEFQEQMAAKGVVVVVHHIRDVGPTELAPADLYVFSSPGRLGKPIRSMRRFLKGVNLPVGTRCQRRRGQDLRDRAQGPLEEGWERKVQGFVTRIPADV
jgi:hypothetical protein